MPNSKIESEMIKCSVLTRLVYKHIEAFFWLLMKAIFDPYVLWPFDKKKFLKLGTSDLDHGPGFNQGFWFGS